MRILVSGKRDFSRFLAALARRGERGFEKAQGPVLKILGAVKSQGDAALLRLTKQYDCWRPSLETIRVSPGEIRKALKTLSREGRRALEEAAERIERFHILQIQKSWSFAEGDGTILGQIVRPMGRVGIYVPGGKASYPSSVLMNAIPARVAGVRKIIMACPAPKGYLNPSILAAACISGVDEIFKVGGAQAIGAMAYGTKTVPKVDKIVGPGNLFVAAAKRLVFGEVSIDSIAGPSEILIISDGSGDPSCIAADLLSQAEHDEQAAAVLLCTSKDFAGEVRKEVSAQLGELPRRKIAEGSLGDFGAILIVKSLSEAIRI
jgi:histidinol dehydrogenase